MITAAYDDTTAAVTVTLSAAPAGASAAYLQRSPDQVNWTDVRGAQAVELDSGAATWLDYEYTAGTTNYYRVSWLGPTSTFVAHGAAVTGNNVPLTPPLPAGIADGQLLLLVASIRSTFVGGHAVTPADWDPLGHTPNGFQIYAHTYATGDTAPTITWTGGAAGDDVIAQIAAFANTTQVGTETELDNGSAAQNVAYQAVTLPADGMALIVAWKADDNTSVTPPAGFTQIDNVSSIAGNDSSVFWFYQLGLTEGTTIPAGSIVVTGGAAAVSASHMISLSSQAQETGSVLVDQTGTWLKWPLLPFLNRSVQLVGPLDDVGPESRSGLFDIIGRNARVAVTDLMSGLDTSYTVETATKADAVDLMTALQTGQVVFFQPPTQDSNLETLYALPGAPKRSIFTENSAKRHTTIPLFECAPPDLTLAATQATLQTILNTFATFTDLLAAEATLGDLLLLVGTPEDVIVS